MRIRTRLFLTLGVLFILGGALAIIVVNRSMKHFALDEAKAKALIMLDRNLAIHTYFTHQLKPLLFKTLDPLKPAGYFEPIWMSSTYAVREIDQYCKALSDKNYYYKECAINARSPGNEADEYEKTFIQKLNGNPDFQEATTVRSIAGQTFLQVLRRGETMENSCLRCHSRPESAPTGMVDRYGDQRSFNRMEGEVVSAISIKIPLSEAFTNADRLSVYLSIVFALVLAVMFAAVGWTSHQWIFSPLQTLCNKASQIAIEPAHLGETISMPQGRELAELTTTFNTMSKNLSIERQNLESRVIERTAELTKVNAKLEFETAERAKVIAELQTALAEIKKLQGILPICSVCKKIRDEAGLWRWMEEYIQDRSEAKFSHSICPVCAKTHYPDMKIYEDE